MSHASVNAKNHLEIGDFFVITGGNLSQISNDGCDHNERGACHSEEEERHDDLRKDQEECMCHGAIVASQGSRC